MKYNAGAQAVHLTVPMLLLFLLLQQTNASDGWSVLKLSIRKTSDERDITIRLTMRSLFLASWLGFGTVLLYEILSFMFLTNRHYTRRQSGSDESSRHSIHMYPRNKTFPDTDETEPLPLVSRTDGRRTVGNTSRRPSRWIVLVWGVATAYAIFYSFEVPFLYMNDRWYQLLGVQLLLTISDTMTWIHLVACCKYGHCPSFTLAQACVGIKLLHLIFNLLGESRQSISSVRHWMFLLEDSTYLWCCRSWLSARPRSFLTFRGIISLMIVVAMSAVVMHNMTSMNRITRV